jgi:hypothetical protein
MIAPNATATVNQESDEELQANQLTKAMEKSETVIRIIVTRRLLLS